MTQTCTVNSRRGFQIFTARLENNEGIRALLKRGLHGWRSTMQLSINPKYEDFAIHIRLP